MRCASSDVPTMSTHIRVSRITMNPPSANLNANYITLSLQLPFNFSLRRSASRWSEAQAML
jgi:hypothetical protein